MGVAGHGHRAWWHGGRGVVGGMGACQEDGQKVVGVMAGLNLEGRSRGKGGSCLWWREDEKEEKEERAEVGLGQQWAV